MRRDARKEFHPDLDAPADAAVFAVYPHHAGREHLPAVGQGLTHFIEAHVNAEGVAGLDGGVAGELDAEAGGADVFGLPAEVSTGGGVVDFNRARLADAEPATPFHMIDVVGLHF